MTLTFSFSLLNDMKRDILDPSHRLIRYMFLRLRNVEVEVSIETLSLTSDRVSNNLCASDVISAFEAAKE